MSELIHTNKEAFGKTTEHLTGDRRFASIRLKKKETSGQFIWAAAIAAGLVCSALNDYLFLRELVLSGAVIGMTIWLRRPGECSPLVDKQDMSAN